LKKLIFIFFVLLKVQLLLGQAESLVFSEKNKKIGDVSFFENNIITFNFENKSNASVYFDPFPAEADLNIDFQRTIVPPGESAFFVVKYYSDKIGSFTRKFKITTNENKNGYELSINGNILSFSNNNKAINTRFNKSLGSDNSGQLSGDKAVNFFIADEDTRKPIPFAKIVVMGLANNKSYVGFSDEKGLITNMIPEGEYILTAMIEGYNQKISKTEIDESLNAVFLLVKKTKKDSVSKPKFEERKPLEVVSNKLNKNNEVKQNVNFNLAQKVNYTKSNFDLKKNIEPRKSMELFAKATIISQIYKEIAPLEVASLKIITSPYIQLKKTFEEKNKVSESVNVISLNLLKESQSSFKVNNVLKPNTLILELSKLVENRKELSSENITQSKISNSIIPLTLISKKDVKMDYSLIELNRIEPVAFNRKANVNEDEIEKNKLEEIEKISTSNFIIESVFQPNVLSKKEINYNEKIENKIVEEIVPKANLSSSEIIYSKALTENKFELNTKDALVLSNNVKIELEINEETPSIEAMAALEKVSEKFSTKEETQKVEETKKVEEAPKEIVVEKIEEIKPAPIVNTKIEKEEEVENDTVVLFEQAPIKREGHLFVFLVDVSESMDKPFRMGLLKVVLDSFFRNLQPNDEVSIVTFNYASKTILPITSASESSLIIKKINDIQPEGGTLGISGVLKAYEYIKPHCKGVNKCHVIIATDGQISQNREEEEVLYNLIYKHFEEGIRFDVMGFNISQQYFLKMNRLVRAGGGAIYNFNATKKNQHLFFLEQLTK
jgi:Mg-chelatase subunit ChlD